MNNLKIFSGTASQCLTQQICQNYGVLPGKIDLVRFPSGESYCQFQENIRGEDVFLVQSVCNPVNETLMELLVMIDAAKRASAGRITVVAPYMGYMRADRKVKSRTPITAKLVADLLSTAGANRIIGMDFHSEQCQGFFNIPVDHLYAINLIYEKFRYEFDPKTLVIISPDVGGVKKATTLAKLLKCDVGFIMKKRLSDTEVASGGLIGNVDGLNVILLDDLTESCGTLLEAAEQCRKGGAANVFAAVSHFLLTNLGYVRLKNNNIINKVITTNSVDFEQNDLPIEILDVSFLFAKAIERIHNNQSLSCLFQVNGV